MRICIYGAGATGGHFAVKLSNAGHDVSVVARGSHLLAIMHNGLTLLSGDSALRAKVDATEKPATLGPQDLVVVAVKATALPDIIDDLATLVGPETLVAFPQNGMSWWYPLGLPADKLTPPDLPIFRLGERFARFLPPERILGGSIYSGNEVIEPGVIKNTSPHRNALSLGLIASGAEARLAEIRSALISANILSPDIDDIRSVIWTKLMSNMSGSALALAIEGKSASLRTDPALSTVYLRTVREGLAIARAAGYDLDKTVIPETLLANQLDHKPSLLQDFERGRPMELAVIVDAPLAFARAAGIETPTMDAIAAIIGRRARDRGLV